MVLLVALVLLRVVLMRVVLHVAMVLLRLVLHVTVVLIPTSPTRSRKARSIRIHTIDGRFLL